MKRLVQLSAAGATAAILLLIGLDDLGLAQAEDEKVERLRELREPESEAAGAIDHAEDASAAARKKAPEREVDVLRQQVFALSFRLGALEAELKKARELASAAQARPDAARLPPLAELERLVDEKAAEMSELKRLGREDEVRVLDLQLSDLNRMIKWRRQELERQRETAHAETEYRMARQRDRAHARSLEHRELLARLTEEKRQLELRHAELVRAEDRGDDEGAAENRHEAEVLEREIDRLQHQLRKLERRSGHDDSHAERREREFEEAIEHIGELRKESLRARLRGRLDEARELAEEAERTEMALERRRDRDAERRHDERRHREHREHRRVWHEIERLRDEVNELREFVERALGKDDEER